MIKICLVSLVCALAWASAPPQYIDALERGMSAIFEDDFPGSQTIFDSLANANLQDPIPQVFSIIAQASAMQDAENYSAADALLAGIAHMDSLFIAIYGEQPKDAWASLAYGTLVGYRAILSHFVEHGSIFSLYGDARKAESLFEAAMSDSAAGNEAASGLGTCYYWFSSKAGLLRSIGIISDRRREGIALMKRAAQKGRFSKDTALHGLVFVSLDYGDTAGAIAAASELRARHPNSRTAKWDLLILHYLTQDWAKALPIADSLLAYYRGRSEFNTCQIAIMGAKAANALGEKSLCRKYILEAEKFVQNEKIKKRLKRHELWDEFEKLREE